MKPKFGQGRVHPVFAAVWYGLIILVVGSIFFSGNSSDETPTSTSSPATSAASSTDADPSARLACERFHSVIDNFVVLSRDGALLRSRIQQVYDTASTSDNAGIPDAARSLLVAATTDDDMAIVSAAKDLAAACAAVGV